MRRFLILFLCSALSFSYAQSDEEQDKQVILLSDMQLQIEINQAMNDLYNFKFAKAEQQFRWLKQKHPGHPLPYFLLGLSEWWKIMPDMDNTSHDDTFLAYMDSVITISEKMYDKPKHKVEASFFLAAAYGFEGRLYSTEERKKWAKSAVVGKNALNYMNEIEDDADLSPELLFGKALYNYFSVWVPENYPLLKPIIVFFPKGDKKLGIKQLTEVSYNAFYTRIEAMVFLMRILNSYENNKPKALQIGEYLHTTYPDNPYFHRYYARLLYSSGRFSEAKPVSEKIIERIDEDMIGYEGTSGRYAAFFLGQIYESEHNSEKAKYYYIRAKNFSEEIEATDTGYYHYSLLALGDIYKKEGNDLESKRYYKLVKKQAKRKDDVHRKAREKLRDF
ncbi:tetratricopeptide repeat protein [Fulvivirga sediminis]|uniref:Tol-pal system protein YbgF n=1 Tax=Fulvivirga sediminis TaxID=2803949 RepID=A0A937K003_9BACT|nr:tol-pal system protein YbgF [Fulvivirga sediminis]MBL3654972.1 tol-pal system protein YbgF [Fulvivirga sediminis]